MSVDGHTTVVALGLLQAALHERIVIHERRLRCRTWREKFRRSFLHHENRASVLRWPSVLILLLTVCALLAAYVAHPRRSVAQTTQGLYRRPHRGVYRRPHRVCIADHRGVYRRPHRVCIADHRVVCHRPHGSVSQTTQGLYRRPKRVVYHRPHGSVSHGTHVCIAYHTGLYLRPHKVCMTDHTRYV